MFSHENDVNSPNGLMRTSSGVFECRRYDENDRKQRKGSEHDEHSVLRQRCGSAPGSRPAHRGGGRPVLGCRFGELEGHVVRHDQTPVSWRARRRCSRLMATANGMDKTVINSASVVP